MTEDLIYGPNEHIYDDLEEMAEVVLDDCDGLLDSLPTKAHYCKPCYGRFHDAKSVADKLLDDWFHQYDRIRDVGCSWHYSYTTAEQLYEWFVDDVYMFCDPEPDERTLEDSRGLKELQEELDRFESANMFLFRIFGECDWFDPSKHSVGLKDLQKALDKATEANKHHYTLLPDSKRPIELSRSFWLEQAKALDIELEELV
jgi:hypothetical protein